MNIALKKLLELNISKYAIAKYCNVKWNTVNLWSKDAFQPSKEHEDCLISLYAQKTKEK